MEETNFISNIVNSTTTMIALAALALAGFFYLVKEILPLLQKKQTNNASIVLIIKLCFALAALFGFLAFAANFGNIFIPHP